MMRAAEDIGEAFTHLAVADFSAPALVRFQTVKNVPQRGAPPVRRRARAANAVHHLVLALWQSARTHEAKVRKKVRNEERGGKYQRERGGKKEGYQRGQDIREGAGIINRERGGEYQREK